MAHRVVLPVKALTTDEHKGRVELKEFSSCNGKVGVRYGLCGSSGDLALLDDLVHHGRHVNRGEHRVSNVNRFRRKTISANHEQYGVAHNKVSVRSR